VISLVLCFSRRGRHSTSKRDWSLDVFSSDLRLVKDPEVCYIPNGSAVANLQVATSESWRDKQTGEMREQTEWHRVVLFGKLAEEIGRASCRDMVYKVISTVSIDMTSKAILFR